MESRPLHTRLVSAATKWSSAWLKPAWSEFLLLVLVFLIGSGIRSVVAKILVVVLAVSATTGLLRSPRLGKHPRIGIFLLLAGIGAALLSTLNAVDTAQVSFALGVMLREIAIFLLVMFLVTRLATVQRLIFTLMLCGSLMGSITVYQHFTGTFQNDYWGFGHASVDHIVGEVDDYRSGGMMADPNYYAQVLVPLLALAFAELFRRPGKGTLAVAAWTLAVCTASVFFTYSRGGFVAFVLALGVLVLSCRPRIIAAVLALVLLLPGFFLVPRYSDRMATFKMFAPARKKQLLTEPGFRGRVSVNLSALQIFTEHPLIGIGIGNFEARYQEYSQRLGIDPRKTRRAAHNLFLETASETGALGLGAFILFLATMFAALQNARSVLREYGSDSHSRLVLNVAIALFAYLVGACFLSRNIETSLLFWILAGVAFSLPTLAREEVQAQRSSVAVCQ